MHVVLHPVGVTTQERFDRMLKSLWTSGLWTEDGWLELRDCGIVDNQWRDEIVPHDAMKPGTGVVFQCAMVRRHRVSKAGKPYKETVRGVRFPREVL